MQSVSDFSLSLKNFDILILFLVIIVKNEIRALISKISNLRRQKLNVYSLEKHDTEILKCLDCEKYINTKLIYVIRKMEKP